MKKLLLIGALLCAATSPLRAQSLSITAPGYTAAKLFDATAGFTITGLAAAPSGDVFYIETDSAYSAASTLYRRSASDAYASATPLFDFGTFAFGSFVLWENGTVYFGENSTGAIRAVNPDLTVDLLGTVAGNYDAVFSGGELYLSHNPGGFGPQNKVSRFTLVPDGAGLALSAPDLILDTPDDYSGPLDFDADGNLFYGGSGSFARSDLFRFTAEEVVAAFGEGTTLMLDAAHRYLANGGNAYLAFDGDDALWQSNFATLNLVDATLPGSTTIATSADNIGHLDRVGQTLYVNMTRSSFDGSAVYTVVPEPGSTLLLALGLASLVGTRRRRA